MSEEEQVGFESEIRAGSKDDRWRHYPDIGKWIRLEVPQNVRVKKVSVTRLRA